MRLFLYNPNTTEALTERLAQSASAVLPADVTLITGTATRGFPYISSRAEAQIAGADVLEAFATRRNDIDAAVIAAFGDPGLSAARELFDMPVAGMTEASMLTGCALGNRFAFVTFTPALAPWYEEQVTRAGLTSRFAGVRFPDTGFGDISSVAEDLKTHLTDVCLSAARDADVLILAGAPIAGLAGDIRGDIPALLLDPIQAAVLQAVTQWRLFPKGADKGSFARPAGKASTGLAGALGTWIHRS